MLCCDSTRGVSPFGEAHASTSKQGLHNRTFHCAMNTRHRWNANVSNPRCGRHWAETHLERGKFRAATHLKGQDIGLRPAWLERGEFRAATHLKWQENAELQPTPKRENVELQPTNECECAYHVWIVVAVAKSAWEKLAGKIQPIVRWKLSVRVTLCSVFWWICTFDVLDTLAVSCASKMNDVKTQWKTTLILHQKPF